ncbi:MAG: efflux RND transporter permease subunit [Ignavibacteriales bacterium]|nr:MAG: efflux RND transporter permease subunit [Ignavibacteriales bacterium]
MKLTDIAIDNKTSVAILSIIIIILGITAYVGLPRESAPDISIPLVIVSTPYPGVSPEDIETLITQPIEKEINAIGEVKSIESSSFEGYSLVRVEFQSGYDIDEALRKVREKVDKARPKLPPDAEEPEVVEINFSEFPILVIDISGPIGLVKLKDIAEDLKDEFEKVDGVLEVKVSGGMEREVKVDVDVQKLQHYNIRFDDINRAIADENKTIPGGSIDVNQTSFLVRIPGEFSKPYIIENLIVKVKDGMPIYLRDVAEVTYSFKERTTYARLNSNDAVSISISKRVGENIIRIADEIKEKLAEKRELLPDDVKFSITSDQSEEIDLQVKDLENNIFSGLVLVIGVLFFFLGFRNALFVSAAIPFSMLISFFVLQLMGVTLNFVVLFALILALGMLVDNAIVIIENIYRFLEEGSDLITAAKKATGEVAWPVITSTFTTVAAFMPLLFWPGIVGDFMFYIPSVLIITLLSSLFVALVINPVIAAQFMKLEEQKAPKGLFGKILMPFHKSTVFFQNTLLPKTIGLYERTLRYAVGSPRDIHRKINKRNWYGVLSFFLIFVLEGVLAAFAPIWVELIVTALAIGFTVWIFTNTKLRFVFASLLTLVFFTQLYGAMNLGVEFFPTTQPQRIYVNVETPSGTNIEETNIITKEVEERLLGRDFSDVDDISVVVGSSTNPFDAGSSTPNKSTTTVQFADYADRDTSSIEISEMIREMVSDIPGAEISIVQQENGPPVGKPVNIEISGDDFTRLGQLAEGVIEYIKDVPGLVDLKDNFDAGKPELRIEVDREKAALYGLNTTLIANFIRTAINGTTPSKYRVKEDEYDITVRLRKDQRESVDALKNLKIIYNNDQGKTLSVPLISVATITTDKGPGAIRRKDLDRVVTITGEALEGENPNDVLQRVKDRLNGYQLPQGYTMEFTGQSKEQEEAAAFLGKAFLIAILMIFLILVIQFDSLNQPLIIMSAVIISLVGVFLGLITFQMPFGIIMTGIGVISLAGVVVNNNIVLIDFTNQLRKRGKSREEAVVLAGLTRFRPVTLTAITTILGLIPLSFGIGFDIYSFTFSFGSESADFWKSMGIAVIFGLGFATFLTLVLVPVIYLTIEEVRDTLRFTLKRVFAKKAE